MDGMGDEGEKQQLQHSGLPAAQSGACLQLQSGDLSQLDMRQQLTCSQPSTMFYWNVSKHFQFSGTGRYTSSRIRIFLIF